MYRSINIIDIKNSTSFNRRNGTISFNSENHIHKILNSNSLLSRKNEILGYFMELKSKSFDDNRLQIRGHDFTHLLFLLIDKIKNKIKLSEETLKRILSVCVCNESLKKERLIIDLNKKYSA